MNSLEELASDAPMTTTPTQRSTTIRSTATLWLSDEDIEQEAQRAFAPHRCLVRFQTDAFDGSRKVALRIVVSTCKSRIGEKEFVVEGVRADALRQRTELEQYLDDVRAQLRQRGVPFAASVRSASNVS
jgi:hypothetical protein